MSATGPDQTWEEGYNAGFYEGKHADNPYSGHDERFHPWNQGVQAGYDDGFWPFYDEGIEARSDRERLEDNPYEPRTLESEMWKRGWIAEFERVHEDRGWHWLFKASDRIVFQPEGEICST